MKKLSTLLAFALIGCYSIVVQVLFIREFMIVFFGSELCLGIIFASWLIGISLGATTGGRLVKRFKKVLIPELNLGQLRKIIRGEYLVDAQGLNKVQGKPFTVAEIKNNIEKLLDGGDERT